MKKYLLIIMLVVVAQLPNHAQVHKHSLGFRLSPGNFRTNTINYQLGLNQHSRLDFGINLSGSFTSNFYQYGGLGAIFYQRVWNITGGLNGFVGAGVQYHFQANNFTSLNNFGHGFTIGPQIGLEYDFSKHKVPLIFGVDYRPGFTINNFNQFSGGLSHNTAFSLKYAF